MKSTEQIFKELTEQCLQCQKPLEDKLIKRAQSRCKKCQRDYEYYWHANSEDFHRLFEGQS